MYWVRCSPGVNPCPSVISYIYINDLPRASSITSKLFADDTCLLFSAYNVTSLQQIANTEITKIENWMTSNKLTLNHTKTKFMVISKTGRISSINISINNHQIDQVNSIDYLGITINSKLTWDDQIKKTRNITLNSLWCHV